MKWRRFIMWSLFVISALFGAVIFSCVRGLWAKTPPITEQAPRLIRQQFGDVTVYALRTGWVSVKEAHRTLQGPDATRLASILLGAQWTEWMPVTVFVIVHPEGVWLVDAGLSEDTLSPEHSNCDPGNHFVYQNLLRFKFAPKDRVDRQLASIGIVQKDIRGVIFTHRHADHTDAISYLPSAATAYVGAGDWPTHNGALQCRWPVERTPVLVDETGPSFGAFLHSTALTKDQRLRVVPLRGHSPGHLGVMVEVEQRFLLFAGDAAFSLEQVQTNTIAGISEDPALARQSLQRILKQLSNFQTFLLPSHDSQSLHRFERRQLSAIE
jgi:N-acyl homoserine lactone hydrolase